MLARKVFKKTLLPNQIWRYISRNHAYKSTCEECCGGACAYISLITEAGVAIPVVGWIGFAATCWSLLIGDRFYNLSFQGIG